MSEDVWYDKSEPERGQLYKSRPEMSSSGLSLLSFGIAPLSTLVGYMANTRV